MTDPATQHVDQLGKRVQKIAAPGRGRFSRALDSVLFLLLCLCAAVAILVTFYTLPRAVGSAPADISLNLATEAVFFWIEVVVIVLGLRRYERWETRRAKWNDLVIVRSALAEAANSIEEERLEFAKKLDKSKKHGGYYATDMTSLNVEVGKIRKKFLHSRYSDDSVTLLTESIWDRVLRSLDLIAGYTYECALEAERLNEELKEQVANGNPDSETSPQLSSQLEAALEKYLETSNTDRYDGFAKLNDAIDKMHRDLSMGRRRWGSTTGDE